MFKAKVWLLSIFNTFILFLFFWFCFRKYHKDAFHLTEQENLVRNRSHIPQTHARTLSSFTNFKDALNDAIVAGSDTASFHRHLTFQTRLLKEGEVDQIRKATSLQTYRMFSLRYTSLCLSRHTSSLISSTGHANRGMSGSAATFEGLAQWSVCTRLI